MKLLTLIFLCSTLTFAASLTITFTANDNAVTDIQSYTETQNYATSQVSVAMLATDTTMTLNTVPAGVTATGTVLVGTELIAYTGVSGSQLTGLTRGTNITNAANNTVAAAHAVGSQVQFLSFPTVRSWIVFIVQRHVQSAILSLGTASVLIGTDVTNINTNQAAENTSLAGAVQ